jgi:hypothetical protein
MPNHPLLQKANRTQQVICVYDNAGEHFLPGADNISEPVTRHIAKSDVLLFIFDPTQDVRFRAACTEQVNDPQMNPERFGMKNDMLNRIQSIRQETILTNIISQIRNLKLLSSREKITIPLIIVLTKYDAWRQLVRGKFLTGKAPHERNPWKRTNVETTCAYNSDRVKEYSQILRTMLLNLIPNLVSTAESSVEKVSYIAVSATGGPPELGEADEQGIRPLCYRPINVKPIWAEVPLFHAQYLVNKSTIPVIRNGKAVM